MADTNSNPLQPILEIPPISRTRRNHGLEHATLHVLSRRFPDRTIAGHSDPKGFWILGNFTLEEIKDGVEEALQRLRNGEKRLAIHPNCGTNFVVSGVLAGLAAMVAMIGVGNRTRDKVERIPLAAVFATIALIISQPLALLFQEKVTTSGEPSGLQIVSITTVYQGKTKAHRIVTKG